MSDKQNNIKLIIYLDDDESKKEKHAIIKEDDFWVYIKLYDVNNNKLFDAPEFKIPKSRVLKIKDYINNKEVKNDRNS